MRNQWIAVFACLGLNCATQAQDAATLSARLARVDALTRLDEPGTKPWHMKLEFSLYDGSKDIRGDGRLSETGTLEEWWAGPRLWKRTVTSKGYSATTVVNQDGEFRTPKTPPLPYPLMVLERQMVHPMPTESVSAGLSPIAIAPATSAQAVECVMLTRPVVGLASPQMGLLPTYCMAPGKDLLLTSYDYGNLAVVRVSMGMFQKHVMPIDVKILMTRVDAVSSHLADLRVLPLTEADFDAAGLEAVDRSRVTLQKPDEEPFLIAHPEAGLPPGVDPKVLSQPVVVRLIVGTDGKVRLIRLISAPDPKLAVAALGTMVHWRWEVKKVDGKPVEWIGDAGLIFSNGLGRGQIGPGTQGIAR